MSSPSESRPSLARLVWTPVGLLVTWILLMWVIEFVDTVALDDRLQRHGLRPREVDGLDGIMWAPFLHTDFGHLASNTVPFLALGGLVAVRGMRYWAWITAITIVIGGGATWLLGGSGLHVGASGVVFGYFGAILGAAVFERRVRTLGAALIEPARRGDPAAADLLGGPPVRPARRCARIEVAGRASGAEGRGALYAGALGARRTLEHRLSRRSAGAGLDP